MTFLLCVSVIAITTASLLERLARSLHRRQSCKAKRSGSTLPQ